MNVLRGASGARVVPDWIRVVFRPWQGGRSRPGVSVVAVAGLIAVVSLIGTISPHHAEGQLRPAAADGGQRTLADGPVALVSAVHTVLTAPDASINDQLGFAVAVDGDTAVVAAAYDQSGPRTLGSAYVFVRSGAVWALQAKLSVPGCRCSVFSVAVDGDTIVLGTPFATVGGGYAAGAYVFLRLGTSWTEQAPLFPTWGNLRTGPGRSVALQGDTVLVGGDGLAGTPVSVFHRTGTVWTEQALLTSGGDPTDYFGESVALDGDTAVVGAREAYAGEGAVYVFHRNGLVWTLQSKLRSTMPHSGLDEFGHSVAVSGPVIVVGAPQRSPIPREGGIGIGAAFVFTNAGGVWTLTDTIFPPDGVVDGQFGWSVAVNGPTVLIGSPQADTVAGSYAGAAYLFAGAGTRWSAQGKLFPTDSQAFDSFGWSVALDRTTALIGSPADNTGVYSAGSADLWELDR